MMLDFMYGTITPGVMVKTINNAKTATSVMEKRELSVGKVHDEIKRRVKFNKNTLNYVSKKSVSS